MTQKRVVVTGSSGLVGSEAVMFFSELGWAVDGVDNNMRRDFFGPDGDTRWNLKRLQQAARSFVPHDLDIRNRDGILALIAEIRPDAIIHCAAQPSHDLAASRPFDDFEINATGTLNLLEAARRACPEAPFLYMSTNKVYGDAPNERALVELDTRWDYADAADHDGIDEGCRIDATTHSLFGASKLAADVLVQEYGRYFGMPTVSLRAGCVTGRNHSGAELHGFLAYLARAVSEGRTYRIFGFKGKQVRDNIHAHDLCLAFSAFIDRPQAGVVYNLGGGRANSVSVREAGALLSEAFGKPFIHEYVDQPRKGDHICYISDMARFRVDYPSWRLTTSLEDIVREFATGELNRVGGAT